MSTNLRIGTQYSNHNPSLYGHLDPFASQNSIRPLCPDAFSSILCFLRPIELMTSERVCKNWNRFINAEAWKRLLQNMLGISGQTDPKKYLPEDSSYKQIFRLISPRILDGRIYQRYIGEVGPVPPIPREISLQKWKEIDPCDPNKNKTIGAAYFWMYCPSHIEITVPCDSYLDKQDDPNDLEAPKLILREIGLVEKFVEKIGLKAKPENKVLKVPVTINNIVKIFNRPKTGNPSAYDFIWHNITEQYGNTRISAGWVCMREAVIERNLSFAQQQEAAKKKGVVLSDLMQRILFNFLKHVCSGRANVYPDGHDPYIFARTSTLTRDQGNDYPSGCGSGGPSGLRVNASIFTASGMGIAVKLSGKV